MALQYELEVLEDMIFETLHPKKIIQQPPGAARIKELMNVLASEKETVPRKIRKVINSLLKENRKCAYLQLQQEGITRMMDAVIHYLLPLDIQSVYSESKSNSIEQLYKSLYVELEIMLHLLKNDFPKYFGYDGKLPDGTRWRMEPSMKAVPEAVRKKLKRKVSQAFLELICEPFEHFYLTDTVYSYRELAYLNELQVFLLAIIEQPLEKVEERITERLLYLNFNSVLFFNYYILRMSDEAGSKKTVSERVEYFSWQIKVINQTLVKSNVVYLRHLPPIRDQLVFWIAEDLYYLDKKHQLSLALPVNREVEKDKLKKVHVQLTVSDLALGARLLLDTDVIVNINYTELMKMVARGFRTNRQANISQQAIYNVGFETSVTSKEKMKNVLMKMVRKIGEY